MTESFFSTCRFIKWFTSCCLFGVHFSPSPPPFFWLCNKYFTCSSTLFLVLSNVLWIPPVSEGSRSHCNFFIHFTLVFMLLFLPQKYLFVKKVIAVCNQYLFYSFKSVRIHNWKKCQIPIPEIFGGDSYKRFRLRNTKMFISCKFLCCFAPWVPLESYCSKQVQTSFKTYFP